MTSTTALIIALCCWIAGFGGGYLVAVDTHFKPKIITNGDLLRSATDEQIAKFIDDDTVLRLAYGKRLIKLPWCKPKCEAADGADCRECILAWLREPADARWMTDITGG